MATGSEMSTVPLPLASPRLNVYLQPPPASTLPLVESVAAASETSSTPEGWKVRPLGLLNFSPNGTLVPDALIRQMCASPVEALYARSSLTKRSPEVGSNARERARFPAGNVQNA